MLDVKDEQINAVERLSQRCPTVSVDVIRREVADAFAGFAVAPIQAFTAFPAQGVVRARLAETGMTPAGRLDRTG